MGSDLDLDLNPKTPIKTEYQKKTQKTQTKKKQIPNPKKQIPKPNLKPKGTQTKSSVQLEETVNIWALNS